MTSVELVDLVDAEGRVVLRAVPRHAGEEHPDLYLQIVILIIFNSAGQVLVHRRAMTKRHNPGDIDVVCGAMCSEDVTPEVAAMREALEETGVAPSDVRIVRKGLNEYGHYRYLLVGTSDATPSVTDTDEVMWVSYMEIEELRRRQALIDGDVERLTFVDGFFEDIAFAHGVIADWTS